MKEARIDGSFLFQLQYCETVLVCSASQLSRLACLQINHTIWVSRLSLVPLTITTSSQAVQTPASKPRKSKHSVFVDSLRGGHVWCKDPSWPKRQFNVVHRHRQLVHCNVAVHVRTYGIQLQDQTLQQTRKHHRIKQHDLASGHLSASSSLILLTSLTSLLLPPPRGTIHKTFPHIEKTFTCGSRETLDTDTALTNALRVGPCSCSSLERSCQDQDLPQSHSERVIHQVFRLYSFVTSAPVPLCSLFFFLFALSMGFLFPFRKH